MDSWMMDGRGSKRLGGGQLDDGRERLGNGQLADERERIGN